MASGQLSISLNASSFPVHAAAVAATAPRHDLRAAGHQLMTNNQRLQAVRSNTPATASLASSYSLSDLPELRNRIRSQVNDVIRGLPSDVSAAYFEAMSKAPDVVMRETDVLQFVRYCGHYDIWGGAERLCAYWRERKALFGEDRFHLPLILTGNGALTKEDILVLHAGYPSILPGTTPQGLRAVVFDKRKWLPNSTHENKLRCIFYLCNLLAQDDVAQVDGVLCLVPLVKPPPPKIEWGYFHKVLSVTYCIPLRFHIHLLNIPRTKKRHLVVGLLERGIDMLHKYFDASLVHLHVEKKKGDLLRALLDLGVPQRSIPEFLGGEWKFQEFYDWLKEQENRELEMHGGPAAAAAAAATSKAPETEEDETAKRRMADLLHSRRKRERKKAEVQSLKDEAEYHTQQNKRFKAEHARLETLLKSARQLEAAMQAPGTS